MMAHEYKLPLSITDIQQIIPHRYPFLFIDQVLEFEDGKKIVGIKNVTANEPFFQGHFPGRPLMPGVIILEAMAQLGALFAKMSSAGVGDRLVVFAGAEEVRFRKPVLPGDVLRLEINDHKRRGPIWRVHCIVTVNGAAVAEGTLTAAVMDQ